MSRRRVPGGDPHVGQLVASGWLTIGVLERKHWPAVARLQQAAAGRGDAAPPASAPTWAAWSRGHLTTPRLVASLEGRVVGWAGLVPVSQLPAYSGVAQVEIHVDAVVQRCGVGRRLLTRLVEDADARSIWSLQAAIVGEGGAGLYLFRRCGFRVIGTRERVALINGQWRGELLMERRSKVPSSGGPVEVNPLKRGTPEWDETIRRLSKIFLDVAEHQIMRATVLGVDVDELHQAYRTGARSPADDDRLVEEILAEKVEQQMRERHERWDNEVREEIARRKREGLPYEHILAYFDR